MQRVALQGLEPSTTTSAATLRRSVAGPHYGATMSIHWVPFEVDGAKVFPSKEEAEYTAPLAFSIAVSVSYWAVRTGHAKLKLGRLPPVETTGHRPHWLYLDHRSLREWAMTPMAISLGLLPPDAQERSRVCPVAAVDDVLQDGVLPANHIYVDQGHHRHRLPTTKWAPPFPTSAAPSGTVWPSFKARCW